MPERIYRADIGCRSEDKWLVAYLRERRADIAVELGRVRRTLVDDNPDGRAKFMALMLEIAIDAMKARGAGPVYFQEHEEL